MKTFDFIKEALEELYELDQIEQSEPRFEIIRLSDTTLPYKDSKGKFSERTWKGCVAGLMNGWQWELRKPDGTLAYTDVSFEYGLPEDNYDFERDHISFWHPDWEFTGRVVFRGYAEEHYDPEERDSYVVEVEV